MSMKARFLSLTLFFGVQVCSTVGALAMDIKPYIWNGYSVLYVSGEIEKDDAKRFSEALAGAKALPHGLPVVLLDSPGGSVPEALSISKGPGKKVHFVVPKGARCASACASIVFVSGAARTVEEGGLLGQHSCAVAGVKFEGCNETISNNAVAHGVSHGSIQAFITYTPPDKMMWFNRADADCWGITRYPFTAEGGFEKSEPCFHRHMTKRWPVAQPAWRIDLKDGSYRAFRRTLVDHVSEGELSMYCGKDATRDGLIVEFRVAQEVARSIRSVSVQADAVNESNLPVSVSRIDDKLSGVTFQINRRQVAPFVKTASFMMLTFNRVSGQPSLSTSALLSTGRGALSFAASKCMS